MLSSRVFALALMAGLLGPVSALAASVGPFPSERQIAAELNQAKVERERMSQQLQGIGSTLSSMKSRASDVERKVNRVQLTSSLAIDVLHTEIAALSGLLRLVLSLGAAMVLIVLLCLARMVQRLARVEAAFERPRASAPPSIEDLLRSPLDHPRMEQTPNDQRQNVA